MTAGLLRSRPHSDSFAPGSPRRMEQPGAEERHRGPRWGTLPRKLRPGAQRAAEAADAAAAGRASASAADGADEEETETVAGPPSDCTVVCG